MHEQAARADSKKQKQAAANAAKKARRAARANEETVENGSAKWTIPEQVSDKG